MEYISESTKAYVPVSSFSDQAEGDPTIPPFTKFPRPHTITVVGYFDTTKPLSEPRWVRTGDIPEWLRSMFGRPVTEGEGWEKKIIVSDPDPVSPLRASGVLSEAHFSPQPFGRY